MKLTLFFLLFSLNLFADTKSIYGADSRVDVLDSGLNPIIRMSSGVSAMIKKDKINQNQNGYIQFQLSNLRETQKVCEDVRFSHQPAIAVCSGFLVSEKHLVTAAHCLEGYNRCQDFAWVFDYHLSREGDDDLKFIDSSDVFSCKQIVAQKLTSWSKEDWAIIELDRPVKNRAILKLSSDIPKIDEDLFVIGTPSGLPLKLATGSVRLALKNYFVTNLDTFSGNSGSPVFSNATGEVMGILVRGDDDFEENNQCYRPLRNTESGGRGEGASYIRDVKSYLGI